MLAIRKYCRRPELTTLQALEAPVSELVGVSDETASVLSKVFQIRTIHDLAESSYFKFAEEVVRALATPEHAYRRLGVPSDLVVKDWEKKPVSEISEADLSAFEGIGEKRKSEIEITLGVRTIRELAAWSPFSHAREILAQVHLAPVSDIESQVASIKRPASINVSGQLRNYTAEEYKKLKIFLYHIAFKGLNEFDKVEKLSDLGKEKGFIKISESNLSEKESFDIPVLLKDETKALFAKGSTLIAYIGDSEGVILGKSKLIKYTPGLLEKDISRVNITLKPLELKNLRTDEFAKAYPKLKDFLPEIRADELRESSKMQFVIDETGLAADDIYTLAYANNFVEELEKLPEGKIDDYKELFYGLIKGSHQLIDSHWDSIYSHLENTEKYLRNAIKYDYIRKDLSKQLNTFIKYLENNLAEKLIEENRDVLPIKMIVSSALSNENRQKIYLTQKAKYKGDPASFHNHLVKARIFNKKEIKAIEFTSDLADLTDNHVPLMEKLKASGVRKTITDLLKPSRDELIEEIKSVDLPESLLQEKPDSSKNELKKSYALIIVRNLESRFPSEITLKYIKEKPGLVGKQRAANIKAFFGSMKAAKKTFNLREHKLTDEGFRNEVKELKPEVVEEIKSLQRIMFLAPDLETSFKLLNNEIRSAYQVASMPQHVFVSNFESVFENIGEAEAYHYRSADLNFYLENIAVLGTETGSSTITQMAGSKLLTDIPRDLCECEHCRSIYGPAAYFVELMQFLRNFHTGALDTGDGSQKPLFELLKRRPDLQHIELSCRNTSTLIPHIDLVNEILEDIVVYGSLEKSEIESHADAKLHIPHETGESTSEELLATPQHTLSPAYRKLSLAKYPTSLPYHQPLDTIQTYLGNLKTSRYALMNLINPRLDNEALVDLSVGQKKDYIKKQNAIAAEYLNLDEEAYKILTGKNFNGTNRANTLRSCYAYPRNAAITNNITKVREFLRRTDIKFTDLIEIIKTKYINPHLHLLDELNEVLGSVTSRNLFDTDTSFSTSLSEHDLIMNVLPGPQAIPETMPSAFNGFDAAMFNVMAEWLNSSSRKENIGRIITIHQDCDLPEDGSILDYMSINYIKKIYGGEVDNELFTTTFTKLYKFIRLWKKLGWSVHELDLAIAALMDKDEDYFYPEFIRKLSAIQRIKDLTKLTVEQILCFWSTINSRGENSLYKKLFLSKSISRLDTGFSLDKDNNLPADKMESHIVAVQAAYRISDEDFNLITSDIGINISADNSFNIDYLSKIYRYVLLAKGFRISIKDIVQLKSLCKIDPFASWSDEYPLKDFVEQLNLIKSSDFEIKDLARICGFGSENDIQNFLVTRWVVETKEQLVKINEEYKILDDSEIIDKDLLVSRFEQAFGPERLESKLKSFEVIENSNDTNINEFFNEMFISDWIPPVINVDDYVDWPDEKIEAFTKTLRMNVLYRDLLTELNNMIRPALLSDMVFTKFSQLLSCDTALVKQLIPEEQCKTLLNKIGENVLEISSQPVGDGLVYQLTNYIHPPQNGSYILSVKTTKELDNISITFDNTEMPEHSMSADQEINFDAKELNADKFYVFNINTDTEITLQDIELFWKQDENDKEIINEIHFYSADFSEIAKTIKSHILGLDRAIEFIKGFGFSLEEVSHFQRCKEQFEDIDFLSINYFHWKRINQYTLLRNLLPITEKTLLAIFELANKGLNGIQLLNELLLLMEVSLNSGDNESELKTLLKNHFNAAKEDLPITAYYLAYITGWNIDDISELLKHDGLVTDPASLDVLKNEIVAAKILPRIKMAKALGISMAQLLTWGKVITETEDNGDLISFNKLQFIADSIKLAVKSKYDDDNWFGIARQLNDKIRENQQSALVAYLLVEKGMEQPDQLYEYFLLDVQMKSQRETARIKQAILSIQLFVQRCLLNLEKENGVGVDSLSRSRWNWMKNYRVWEANKKVFVNPENWLEPELRRDKSPFFKELESELMQNDISVDTVETALRNYLTKLDQVARLDVCGLYDDVEKSTEYIFARTSNAPYTYYFRTKKYSSSDQWAKFKDKYWRWSPWEEVKVDIDTIEDGENSWLHLMPVVWKGRLMIYWPVFREKTKSQFTDMPISKTSSNNGSRVTADGKLLAPLGHELSTSGTGLDGNFSEDEGRTLEEMAKEDISNIKPIRYWEIHLAWSEYKNTKWGKKQISSEFISTETQSGVTQKDKQYQISDAMENFYTCAQNYKDSKLRTGEVPIYCSNDAPDNNEYEFWHRGYHWIHDDPWPPTDQSYNPPFIKLNAKTESPSEELYGCNPYFYYRQIGGQLEELYSLTILNMIIDNTDKNNKAGAKDWIDGEDKFINVNALKNNFSFSNITALTDPENQLNAASKSLEEAVKLYIAARKLTVIDDDKAELDTTYKNPWKFSFQTTVDNDENLRIDLFGGIENTGFLLTSLHDRPQIHKLPPVSSLYIPNYYNFKKIVWNGVLYNDVDNNLNNSVDNNLIVIKNDYYHFIDDTFIFQDNNRKYYALKRGFPHWDYRFFNFYHPMVNEFVSILNRKGISSFFDLETQLLDKRCENNLIPFVAVYDPSDQVFSGYPKEKVEFLLRKAYSGYNWELFFHIPLFIATHLSKNNKFKEARDWFHFLFDPTSPELDEEKRYWRFLPFRKEDAVEDDSTFFDWRDHPFQPHYYAQKRGTESYKLNVIMRYLDNLIAWGDTHFRRYSMESLGEATQLYVMASLLLGPGPDFIPERGKRNPETYHSIMERLDAYSSNVSDLEYELVAPFSGNIDTGDEYDSTPGNILGYGLGKYFCIPFNSKLLEYWDVVEQRLYNIRHGLDINGIRRPLALFEPELDPGMLVNGAASGLSIAGMLGQLNAPVPYYRFSYMVQKAIEICADIKGLGSNLLATIEKNDAEKLSIIRSTQELGMLNLVKQIKQLHRDESIEALEGIKISRVATAKRMKHYLDLLGVDAEDVIPDEEAVELIEIEPDVDLSLVEIEGVEGLKLIAMEKADLDLAEESNYLQISASGMEILASVINMIPNFSADGKPLGIGAGVSIGGSNFGAAVSAFSKSTQIAASHMSYSAARASKIGAYFRREQDWVFQANMAGRELIQMNSQLKVVQMRLEIAERELVNHDKQTENAEQTDEFLRSKFSNIELYTWMKNRLIDIYKHTFDMAFDLAKKAERTYQFERGEYSTNFIQYNYWNSAKEGLLAGESLHLALRQMEKSFLDKNKRELEITKNISLLRLNPEELLRFKLTGTCEFELPEALFDLDFPGHYMRRIKSVSLTIPCVVGPYTSINCTLRQLRNEIRLVNIAGDYPREQEGDNRFLVNFVSTQSIATSNGQNDSGLFELNFRDERYLPFEGSGVISRWKLEMETAFPQFDFNTISDVILTVNYTARDGGETLKSLARDHVTTFANATSGESEDQGGFFRAINLKHEFPNQWHMLMTEGESEFIIKRELLPYFSAISENLQPQNITWFVKNESGNGNINITTNSDTNPSVIPILDTTDKVELSGYDIVVNMAGFEFDHPFKISGDGFEEIIMILKYIQ